MNKTLLKITVYVAGAAIGFTVGWVIAGLQKEPETVSIMNPLLRMEIRSFSRMIHEGSSLLNGECRGEEVTETVAEACDLLERIIIPASACAANVLDVDPEEVQGTDHYSRDLGADDADLARVRLECILAEIEP